MKASYKGEFTVKPYIDQGPYYPSMSSPEIASCYNGIGAAWMNEKVRKILDKWFAIFKDTIIIHDVGYEKGLTPEDKIEEDERMKRNMYRDIWHNVSIFNVKKIIILFLCVRIMYRLVQLKGDKAFWANKTKP